jgi:hypothetical protein
MASDSERFSIFRHTPLAKTLRRECARSQALRSSASAEAGSIRLQTQHVRGSGVLQCNWLYFVPSGMALFSARRATKDCLGVPSLKDLLDLLAAAWRWVQCRRNPVRSQAARALLVFRSHGIHPTQINRHLPEALRLPAIQWSTPDHLKAVLGQPHIDCINAYFALDPLWLEGEAASPHQLIPSYKDPRALYDWLKARNPHDAPGIFKVHFISSDGAEISSGTHGDFAMVLEHFAEHASAPSLFFYLTEGAHFSHQPCILHLMQTLAILHVNGASMQRSTLPPKALAQLSENIGSIPAVLTKSRPHRLAADHELWDHYSGSSPWLASLRSEMESTLIAAGLPDVVAKVRADALKWARK